MLKKLFPALLLVGSFSFAQVGVNTDLPNATLDVAGNPTDILKFDGIIAPRITGDQLNLKTYTPLQTGALVYVTAAGALNGQTADVSTAGYYYFNGDLNKWVKLNTGISAVPWNLQNTANPAVSNNQNIYQNGKVGIGFTPADAVSDRQFEVKGDMKAQYGTGSNYFGIDTNLLGVGNGFYYSDNSDLSAATNTSVVMTRPGISTLQSNNGLGGGSIAAFSESTGGSFALVSNNLDQSISASIWGISNGSISNLTLSHNGAGTASTDITLEKLKGVSFSYKDASGAPQGNYTFPRTSGQASQVLATDGAGTLSWRDASSLNAKIRTLSSGAVAPDDYTILVTGDISLPAATAANQGKVYNLVNDTAGNVTINGSFRINGGNFTNYGLNNSDWGRAIVVQSTGSAWVVISRY
ncbi:hypothetical protein DRF60_14800 [Chryseobacterium elymi]|uniref:T9SS C-terminal target domain-containing protein n=1 Tax=Chryseobacterium elymi TaxID=395936 RepID=A0A3D9DDV7_9FLAO|nr:hypothetical protein [Chryseobacterium elymi]REC76148.1 hypothetical protein DRF60_14800 [Chryseobacterium elymi]